MKIINIKEAIIYFNEKNIIEYLSLLDQLSNVYQNDDELKFMINNFKRNIIKLPENINIYVILDLEVSKLPKNIFLQTIYII